MKAVQLKTALQDEFTADLESGWVTWVPETPPIRQVGEAELTYNVFSCPRVRVRVNGKDKTVSIDRSVDGEVWATDTLKFD